MKRLFYALMVLVLAGMLIGACPNPNPDGYPGCAYCNNCSTWTMSGVTAKQDATGITVNVTVTIGDPATSCNGKPLGRLIIITDGEFTCTACGSDNTTWTGTLLYDHIYDATTDGNVITFSQHFTIDTSKQHTIQVYWAQGLCANCHKVSDPITVPPYVPPYIPPKPFWLQMWMCTDNSLCFNTGITPGPDGACFVYDLSGKVIPTSSAATLCFYDGTPMKLVYSGWVTLPAPGIKQCWGDSKDAAKCNHAGDIILAKINHDHHWHLAYSWFFKGYGGH